MKWHAISTANVSRAHRLCYTHPVLLVLLRHADSPSGRPDNMRPLSSKGDEQAQATGVALRDKLDPSSEVTIWCSPLVRARQTAGHIAAALGIQREPRQCSFLTPDASPGELLAALDEQPADAIIIAVTHEYLVSDAATVVQGRPAPGFRTAEARAFALERCEPSGGQLAWRIESH